MDQTDLAIIECLKENARSQWKEIGEKVHLTGQAVAARIDRMTEEGIIRRFTVETDHEKLGISLSGYIMVFMKTPYHDRFIDFFSGNIKILEASRISGEGCYLLKYGVRNQSELNELLNEILVYGNYRLNIEVKKLK